MKTHECEHHDKLVTLTAVVVMAALLCGPLRVHAAAMPATLYVGGDLAIQAVEADSGAALRTTAHSRGAWNVSRDGMRLYFAPIAGPFTVTYLPTGTVERSIALPLDPGLRALELNGDESTAFVLASNGQLLILDIASESIRSHAVDAGAEFLALTADGATLVVVGQTGLSRVIVQLVDVATGTIVAQRTASTPGRAVAMRIDRLSNSIYVAMSQANAVVAFDPGDAEPERTVVLGVFPLVDVPESLLLAEDGKAAYVATRGLVDREARLLLLDTETMAIVDSIALPSRVSSIALSDDGSRLYVGHRDACSVSVVDLSLGEIVDSIEVFDHPQQLAVRGTGPWPLPEVGVPSSASRAGGEHFGTCAWVSHSSGEVSVIDVDAHVRLGSFPASNPGRIAFDPDGTRAFLTGNSVVAAFDSATYEETARWAIGNTPMSLVIGPDASALLVGLLASPCHDVLALDPQDGSLQGRLGCDVCAVSPGEFRGTLDVKYTSDGSRAYAVVLTHDTGAVLEIDVASTSLLATIPLDAQPGRIELSPDGTRLYVALRSVGSGSRGVAIIDTATRTVSPPIPLGPRTANAYGLRVHPSGTPLYVFHSFDNRSHMSWVDPDGPAVLGRMDGLVGGMAFVPEREMAYVLRAGGVAVFDTETNSVVRTINTPANPQDIVIARIPGGCAMPPNYCLGDCDGDGSVTIDELLTGVTMALGGETGFCRAFDPNQEGGPTIDLLVGGVENAIHGCGAPPR